MVLVLKFLVLLSKTYALKPKSKTLASGNISLPPAPHLYCIIGPKALLFSNRERWVKGEKGLPTKIDFDLVPLVSKAGRVLFQSSDQVSIQTPSCHLRQRMVVE